MSTFLTMKMKKDAHSVETSNQNGQSKKKDREDREDKEDGEDSGFQVCAGY